MENEEQKIFTTQRTVYPWKLITLVPKYNHLNKPITRRSRIITSWQHEQFLEINSTAFRISAHRGGGNLLLLIKLCSATRSTTPHRAVDYMRDLDPEDDEAGALCREKQKEVYALLAQKVREESPRVLKKEEKMGRPLPMVCLLLLFLPKTSMACRNHQIFETISSGYHIHISAQPGQPKRRCRHCQIKTLAMRYTC